MIAFLCGKWTVLFPPFSLTAKLKTYEEFWSTIVTIEPSPWHIS